MSTKLTDLEMKVLKQFENGHLYDDAPYFHFDDLVCSDLPARRLRGVVSSLLKKWCLQELDGHLKGCFYLWIGCDDDPQPYFDAVKVEGDRFKITFPQ
tara:strand:- start:325 stop:618 length:294 start_codon:yes stop_codon:yes gene_type:complete